MSLVVAGVFGTIGLVAVVGGVVGYKKAKSTASLVAGAVSGGLLVAAASLIATGSATLGLGLGTVSCAALAGRFIPAYVRTRRLMPQGLMAVLSGVGLLTALAAVVLR